MPSAARAMRRAHGRRTALRALCRVSHVDESGQGMLEYGLVLVLIAAVAVAGVEAFGGDVLELTRAIGDVVSGLV